MIAEVHIQKLSSMHPGSNSDHARWEPINVANFNAEQCENWVEATLAQMTLDEKLGQMIQAEVQQLDPADIGRYKIGSALNGSGVWPNKDRFSSPQAWAEMIDRYFMASAESFRGRPFSIPFAWATDAIHGHNNLHRATIFPHNIGLGATRDPDLVQRIGQVTATELAASGMDWTFAPTVAVPLDARWGRFYEGYAQDATVVADFAGAMVRGLQGTGATSRSHDTAVLSSVKHWIGDGGTRWGIDRGNNFCSEQELIELHSAGYRSALEAGAQVVMVSFSSWEHETNYDHAPLVGSAYNFKLHGSRYLITDVLKKQLGFDGIVLTDWDGHCEVSKCTLKDARYCINAGADMLMVEARGDWLAILDQTKRDLEEGHISPERIADAVRRILRVKYRTHLAERPRPSERAAVKNAASIIGSNQHREVARESVRKSAVLLKNNGGLLPLAANARILLAGSAAHSFSKQMGGWSLHWHSNELQQEDFPAATTLGQALHEAIVSGSVTELNPGESLDPSSVDCAVVVFGEDAYSEMLGDIRPWDTLEYAALKPSYAEDLALLRRLHEKKIPIVSVFFTGRPLYLNEEINLSHAFVIAWLPGMACEGITDLLVRAEDGTIRHDFQGTLPCAWPATPYGFRLTNALDTKVDDLHPEYAGDQEILFDLGYGLQVNQPDSHVDAPLYPLNQHDASPIPPRALNDLVLLGPNADPRFTCRIAGNGFWVGADVSRNAPTDALLGTLEPFDYLGKNDAFHVFFNGRIASLYFQFPRWNIEDMRGFLIAGAALVLSLRIHELSPGPVRFSAHNCFPSKGIYDATTLVQNAPIGEWIRLRVPLADIAASGSDFSKVNVPFMLHTQARIRFDIGDLRWEIPDNRSGLNARA